MCPRLGRPTDNKKTERFEVRLTPEEMKKVQECAEKMGITKTEVVKRGIQLVAEKASEE